MRIYYQIGEIMRISDEFLEIKCLGNALSWVSQKDILLFFFYLFRVKKIQETKNLNVTVTLRKVDSPNWIQGMQFYFLF